IGLLFPPGLGEALVDSIATRRPRHSPAHQGVEVERQEACLMRPIFEHPPLAPAEGALVERRLLIVPGAREDRKIMRAYQHIDAVDLEEAHIGDGAFDPRPVSAAVALRLCQALRCKRDLLRLRY